MPIVISRSGTVLQAPTYTQEQKDKAWEILTQGWAKSHPDILRQLSQPPPAKASGE